MKIIKAFLFLFYIILQCTWGLCQTIVGFVFFLININNPHHFYKGCIETEWNSEYSGISLGLFIFTPRHQHSEVRVHEYGHTIQSLVLGPFYLIVGIISLSWANLPYFVNMRRTRKIPYTRCFVEAHASKLGELVSGEKAIWS